MSTCLFCDIAAGKIPCEQVHSDENFFAFRDISPAAPTHILIIPRTHISSLTELDETQTTMSGQLLVLASRLAAQENLDANGYRFVINCGQDGGQTVGHLHLHILGGRKLAWPPG
ncbi:MAG: histidine triad nucleotide-binding protein [Candidatus Krumholzibacteria bacterium]|nr:histidine triad nucleotide-binding protein [Candidatus Krumholzibacteria bacterium]